MDPTDLGRDRWHRLGAGVGGGLVLAFVGYLISSNVRGHGTRAAHDWGVWCSMCFGFALGYGFAGAAFDAISRSTWWKHRLPEARLVRPRAEPRDHLDPTNLDRDRWYRLGVGLAGGVAVAWLGQLIAMGVTRIPNHQAHGWLVLCTICFGFALGYGVAAAVYDALARAAWWKHRMPRARVVSGSTSGARSARAGRRLRGAP